MSYSIDYRYVVFKFDSKRAHEALAVLEEKRNGRPDSLRLFMAGDFFVCFVECGESNCYEAGGRRARSWKLQICGSYRDCIDHAIESARGVEKGDIVIRGREMRAEGYIAAFRKRLDGAQPLSNLSSRLEGNYLRVGLHTFNGIRAKEHAGWQSAVTYVPQYRYENQGLILDKVTQQNLELALVNLSECFGGQCSTMATMSESFHLTSLLSRLADAEQLSLV